VADACSRSPSRNDLIPASLDSGCSLLSVQTNVCTKSKRLTPQKHSLIAKQFDIYLYQPVHHFKNLGRQNARVASSPFFALPQAKLALASLAWSYGLCFLSKTNWGTSVSGAFSRYGKVCGSMLWVQQPPQFFRCCQPVTNPADCKRGVTASHARWFSMQIFEKLPFGFRRLVESHGHRVWAFAQNTALLSQTIYSNHAPGHQLESKQSFRRGSNPALGWSLPQLVLNNRRISSHVARGSAPQGYRCIRRCTVKVDSGFSTGVSLTQHDLLAFSFPNTQAETYCISSTLFSRFGYRLWIASELPEGSLCKTPIQNWHWYITGSPSRAWWVELFTS